MNWNQFKYQIKTNMLKHEAEQDYMELWRALEPEVIKLNHSKKKKRRLAFFILFGVIVISSLVGVWSLNSKSLLKEKGVEDSSKNQIRITQPKPIVAVPTEDSNTIHPAKNETYTTNNLNQNKVSEPILSKTRALSLEHNYWNEIKRDSNISLGNDTAYNHLNSSSLAEERDLPIESVKNNIKIANVEPTENFKENADSNAQGKADQNLHLLVIKSIEKFDEGQIFAMNILETDRVYDDQDVNVQNKFKLSVRLNAYLFSTQRSLSPKSNMDNTLSQIREITETPLETSQFEILVDFKKGNFGIASGLSYTQVMERLNFTDSVNEIVEVTGVKSQVSNLAGSLIDIDGQINNEFQQNIHYTKFNKYRFIDIPVLVNYQLNSGKWSFIFETGPYFNISLNGRGSILTEQLEFQDLDDADILKDRVGVSLGVNARIQRSIGKYINLQFGPSYRWHPNSITNDDSTIDQSYNLIGGSASLQYKF